MMTVIMTKIYPENRRSCFHCEAARHGDGGDGDDVEDVDNDADDGVKDDDDDNDDADDVKEDYDDDAQHCPLQKAVCPCPAQLSSSSAQKWQKNCPRNSFFEYPRNPSYEYIVNVNRMHSWNGPLYMS